MTKLDLCEDIDDRDNAFCCAEYIINFRNALLVALGRTAYWEEVSPKMDLILSVAKKQRITVIKAFEAVTIEPLSRNDAPEISVLSAALYELYLLGHRGKPN